MRRNSFRRFSLVELLVVVAIIGVLASLLQPSLTKLVSHSQMVSCQKQLQRFGHWVIEFSEDRDGMWPRNTKDVSDKDWDGRWYMQLRPYSGATEKGRSFDGYACVAKEEDEYYQNYYGINMEISCINNKGTDKVHKRHLAWHSFHQVTNTRLVMYSESKSTSFTWRHGHRNDGNYQGMGPGERAREYGYPGYVREDDGGYGVDPIHDGKSLYLHADASVSAVTVEDWVLGFKAHAEKFFHPQGDGTILPPGPPPGMTW